MPPTLLLRKGLAKRGKLFRTHACFALRQLASFYWPTKEFCSFHIRKLFRSSAHAISINHGVDGFDRCDARLLRDRAAQNRADERTALVNDRQADGVQGGYRRIKNLAAAQRHKSVAEGDCRCQIQRRHRGHPHADKPRRLIASSPKIPHSSLRY